MGWAGLAISAWLPCPPVPVHTQHLGILGPHCLGELKSNVAVGSTFLGLGGGVGETDAF